jgi:hypothetical protein
MMGGPAALSRYTLGGMCKAIVCPTCHRPGWSGCGAHVEQVLGHVAPEKRCQCRAEKVQQKPRFRWPRRTR